MSKKSDYNEAEWKAISAAPVAAGLFIALSDVGGPIGAFKEAIAVGRAIMDSASGDAPEIVKDLAATVRSGRPTRKIHGGNGSGLQRGHKSYRDASGATETAIEVFETKRLPDLVREAITRACPCPTVAQNCTLLQSSRRYRVLVHTQWRRTTI